MISGPTATGVVGVVTSASMSAFSGFATTGDSDVSPDNVASQFLLFRGLEPGVNEDLLAKGVTKLYKTRGSSPPADSQGPKKTKISSTSSDASLGAKEGTLRRVLLIRDRKSNDSWRYGFAEFSSVEDAQAAMAKYISSDKFTISSKPVLVSYIHAGVFVPVMQAPSPELDKFTFSPLSNPSLKLMYWDEAGYTSELVTARDERSPLTKAKESLNARLAAAAAKEGLLGENKDVETKAKKRKVEKDVSSSNKKVAPHLQFWSNRHAELHGLPPKDEDASDNVALSVSKESKAERPTPSSQTTQSFADMNRKCCLLCSRQFKTEAEVTKHERVSQLHRDNLQNGELRTKALAKLIKAGTVQPESESSGYRDRAKERREAFNQPKQPAAQHNKVQKESATPKEEDPAPVQSKGAALLGKMGWTAGEGLGAQGTGRTEAITTEMYTQGVGLGAQGGKIGDAIEEADRTTRNSYADFVNKSKDKAKERFERLG
jgi:RNA-binding protein 5/10